MNELADTNRILFAQPPDNWTRPHNTWIQNVCNDLSSFGMEERKGKERKSIYIVPFRTKVHPKRSGMDHTVLPANNTMPAIKGSMYKAMR